MMMRYEELATQIVVAALNAGHSYAPEKIVELYRTVYECMYNRHEEELQKFHNS
jgi:hypothetical protein